MTICLLSLTSLILGETLDHLRLWRPPPLSFKTSAHGGLFTGSLPSDLLPWGLLLARAVLDFPVENLEVLESSCPSEKAHNQDGWQSGG